MLEEHPDLREVDRLAYAPSAVVVVVDERRPAPPDHRLEADSTTPAALRPAVLTNASHPPGTPSDDRATR